MLITRERCGSPWERRRVRRAIFRRMEADFMSIDQLIALLALVVMIVKLAGGKDSR